MYTNNYIQHEYLLTDKNRILYIQAVQKLQVSNSNNKKG